MGPAGIRLGCDRVECKRVVGLVYRFVFAENSRIVRGRCEG